MKQTDLPLKPLAAAIVLASGQAQLQAATYELAFSGHLINQTYQIFNVPGVPTALTPALYQYPRQGAFDPPGRETTALVSIDASSGEVVDFEYSILGGGWHGSGGPQLLLYPDEMIFTASAGFHAEANGPGGRCSVVNGADDADGMLVYDCPNIASLAPFYLIDANLTGTLCATSRPSTLAPGQNGCANAWSDFPQPQYQPVTANGAGVALPANHSIGGVPVSLTGSNPPFYRSLDHQQNMTSLSWLETGEDKTGANFVLTHSGTLAGGDFQVQSMQFTEGWALQVTNPNDLGPAPDFIFYQYRFFDYATVSEQQLEFAPGEAKAVPALGTGWLAGMLMGVVALALGLPGQRGRRR